MHRARKSAIRTWMWLQRWGFDPRQTHLRIKWIGRARANKRLLLQQKDVSNDGLSFPLGESYLITGDWSDEGGVATGHYFHQDLIVARSIFHANPERHIDVGSRVDGFVAHVATFREIEVMDVREISADVSGITFHQMDLMSLPSEWYGSADSVSCLHALEHFGLGRYGDPINFDGWREGLINLFALLEPGGTLYLSVPTGKVQRIEFNAHRVFSLPFLRNALAQYSSINRLDFVRDDGSLISDVDFHGDEAEKSFDSSYGCSIWTLTKYA